MNYVQMSNSIYHVAKPVNKGHQSSSEQESLKINFTTYALLLFILLSNFNKFLFGVGFSGVILPIALFCFLLLIERRKFRFTKSHIYIFLFWVFAVISTSFSSLVEVKSDSITFMIFTLFFIFSTAIRYNENEIRLIFNFYKVISILISFNIIYNYINDISYGWQRYSLNLLGLERDPNYVSAFLPMAIILLLLEILYSENSSIIQKLLKYIAVIIITFGVFLTGSRATFLVFLLGVILVIFRYMIHVRKRKMFLTLILAMIIIMIGWKFFESQIPQSTIDRLTTFETYSGDVRVILARESMHLFYNSPVFGSGLNSTARYLFSVGYFHSHNMYVDILTSQGLIGLSLLLLYILRGILVSKKEQFHMFVFSILLFGPLFFINAFNTTSFWLPMIIYEILSSSLRRSDIVFTDIL